MNTKNIVIVIIVLILIGTAGFFFMKKPVNETTQNNPPAGVSTTTRTENSTTTATTQSQQARGDTTIIGTSVDGADITAYHFGTGKTELLFIGGIHGGYSWNTALLAYEMIDYLEANQGEFPSDITVTIIPAANPDGLTEAVGTSGLFKASVATTLTEAVRVASRFNENDVDLNRNFDCDWKTTSMWRNQEVKGGDKPFSEPEAKAIRDYVLKNKPAAAVVWFSSEGKIYPSACGEAPTDKSLALASTFGTAAGYDVSKEFDAYVINGDMVNWMAKENIPAISVLLSTHQDTELSKNQAGLKAVIEAYSN